MMRNLIVALAIVIGMLCLGFIITQDAGNQVAAIQPPAILVSYVTLDDYGSGSD